MTEAAAGLKSQLSALSQQDRAEMAFFLLTSLEPEEEGVEAVWKAEVSRRLEEIRSGKVIGKPADQLFAEMRELYP
ncbi:MAG: addiction module protein [Gemmataceae bacterium]